MTFRDFDRFAKIQQPLVQRREQLVKVKRIHQFIRDVEDEKLWIDEKVDCLLNVQCKYFRHIQDDILHFKE
jgi:hypothetical protein